MASETYLSFTIGKITYLSNFLKICANCFKLFASFCKSVYSKSTFLNSWTVAGNSVIPVPGIYDIIYNAPKIILRSLSINSLTPGCLTFMTYSFPSLVPFPVALYTYPILPEAIGYSSNLKTELISSPKSS